MLVDAIGRESTEIEEYMWQSRITQWRSNKINAEDLKSVARDHMMLVDAIRREGTDTNGRLYHPTFKDHARLWGILNMCAAAAMNLSSNFLRRDLFGFFLVLLHDHCSPDCLQLFNDLLGFLLAHSLLQQSGSLLHQILGLLESECSERSHLFDDLDL